MMILKTCTDHKAAFNAIAKIEQTLSPKEIIINSELICSLGETKIEVIKQIINAIEFFLKVAGKEMEGYLIQILAGDLYDKFRTDTLEDVILMFKMARTAEFGTLYTCKPPEIMGFAQKYLDFKSAEREKLLSQKPPPQKEVITGKSFHELSPELQEKFNSLSKNGLTEQFLPEGAKAMLTTDKHLRGIQKLIINEKS